MQSRNDIRDSREHALVDTEQQIWDSGAANGWLAKDTSEPDVLQVADISRSIVAEGERVSPEEPLEGHQADGHQGEPDEREGGLAACQARVEESHSGNHEQDKGGGCENPGDITRLREREREGQRCPDDETKNLV